MGYSLKEFDRMMKANDQVEINRGFSTPNEPTKAESAEIEESRVRTEPVIFRIWGRPESWNVAIQAAKTSAHAYAKLVNEWKGITLYALLEDGIELGPLYADPVDIYMTAVYETMVGVDSDNIFQKPIIDALRGHLLSDDSGNYVRRTTKEVQLGKGEPTHLLIRIQRID